MYSWGGGRGANRPRHRPYNIRLRTSFRSLINLRPVGGGLFSPTTPVVFHKYRENEVPSFIHLFIHQFRTLPENLSPRSSQARSPSQVKLHNLKIILMIAPWLQFLNYQHEDFRRWQKGITTYKIYISEFRFRCSEVKSILRADHCKAMWKCWNAVFSESTSKNVPFLARYPQNCTTLGDLYVVLTQWPSLQDIRGHMRSNWFLATSNFE